MSKEEGVSSGKPPLLPFAIACSSVLLFPSRSLNEGNLYDGVPAAAALP
jgi:hypothetical protein